MVGLCLKMSKLAKRVVKVSGQKYCKYYSQGIVIFLVSNGLVDSKLLTDYYWV